MYALFVILIIVGIVAALVGVCVFANAFEPFADRFNWQPLAAGIAIVVLGAGLATFGSIQTNNIDRQQCEAAGFEWITGTCYGTNVNVNGK